MKVNIYLETDKQCQACIQRKYGYVIEIMHHGQIVTREGFGCVVSTYLAAGGFKDTKGNEIKNADEWRKVYGPIDRLKLEVSSSAGTHSYSQWLQEEMIKHGDS